MNQAAFPRLRVTLASAAVLLALVGCGSNVKLDDVPVSDRTGSSTQVDPNAAGSQGSTGRVAPVVVDEQAIAEPPASVGRVIYFDYDSYLVKPEFAATLDAHAKFLKADAKRRVVLQGHTDDRGTREYNLALGQKRAEAVRRALGVLGVSDAQQEAVSFGKEKPAAMGADEAAHAKNRRVELVYR
ncbi:peptidoglycan-associated lipoprotein [Hydrogenophaga soli]|nr:peptidoglycan-associated lipoprotein Pal [Burkholderiaceae bacterium]